VYSWVGFYPDRRPVGYYPPNPTGRVLTLLGRKRMNSYDTPKIGPDSGSRLPSKTCMPPGPVILSISGIALTLSLGIIKLFYLAYQRGALRLDPIGPIVGFIIGITIFIGIIYLILRGLYRGSKLAFWFVVVYSVLTIMTLKGSLNQISKFQNLWEKELFVFQGIVQFTSAAVLLLPSSRRWFYKKNQEAQVQERSATE